MKQQPELHIGILNSPSISFELSAEFSLTAGTKMNFSAKNKCVLKNGKIEINGKAFNDNIIELFPVHESATFRLFDVKIGIGFHWEQHENQLFKGKLVFQIIDDELWAINTIKTEDYITSVITSEMNVNAPVEFIKAHAVISRSWALAQIDPVKGQSSKALNWKETADEKVVWYDKQNHTHFDVCADDHCQRYQGLSRITNNNAKMAIEETYGEVLMFDDHICDTRFSKCCGGISEDFENVWQPEHYPYLTAISDHKNSNLLLDLSTEKKFSAWLQQPNEAFCNTKDAEILSSVLNDYDQSTTAFFRWKEEYNAEDLSTIIKTKSGIDFGEIQELIPLERGKSGRLIRLKIIGSKRTMIIGKELEIRRILSPTHLYSSAFTCQKISKNNTTQFVLKGAGWGHGVGLCQIGAAVMSFKGYTYQDILEHYFKGAKTRQIYAK